MDVGFLNFLNFFFFFLSFFFLHQLKDKLDQIKEKIYWQRKHNLRATVSIYQTNSKNRGKPQKIDFVQTLYFGGAISAKSCYAVGFLKYGVIIEKCANFDNATEAAILTRIGKPCIQSP